MNKNLLSIGLCLLVAGFATPAAGYHIAAGPTTVTVTPPGTPNTIAQLSAGDFVAANPLLVLCESNGPTDPINPSGVPQLNGVVDVNGQPGIGGLCYSGRNGVTGTAAPALPVAVGTWTKLDVCTATTAQRASSACGSSGWGYVAQLGVYQCFVPTAPAPLPPVDPTVDATLTTARSILFAHASVDWAFYYDENYASLTWAAPVTGGNGHVAVFPDVSSSDPLALGLSAAAASGSPLVGSVQTSAYTIPAGLSISDTAGADGFNNACGGSPACPPSPPAATTTCSTPDGPVFRAPA